MVRKHRKATKSTRTGKDSKDVKEATCRWKSAARPGNSEKKRIKIPIRVCLFLKRGDCARSEALVIVVESRKILKSKESVEYEQVSYTRLGGDTL